MNCSRILNLMVLFGFMVNYMLRVNFTIAIVDMISNLTKNHLNNQVTNLSTLFLNDTNVSCMFYKIIMYFLKYFMKLIFINYYIYLFI